MTTLYVCDSGEFREAGKQDVLECARGLLAQGFRRGSPVLKRPDSAWEFLQVHLGDREHEVFGLLYLDARFRLIAVEDLFRGTIDSAPVHPREVVRRALEKNASSVIAYHNHPSGSLDPSPADEQITQQLKAALALIDVHLLDHLIVGDGIYSMAANGLL